jgi:hypothetical protein
MTKVVESIKYGIEQNEWTKIQTRHVDVVLKVLKTAWGLRSNRRCFNSKVHVAYGTLGNKVKRMPETYGQG